MPDYVYRISRGRKVAVAVVKAITMHPVLIDQFNVPELPVMIPTDKHDPGAQLPESIDETNRCALGQVAMDNVTDYHQGFRLVIRHQVP